MYGTPETSHSPTEYYVRLDDSVFKHTINARDVGKKIYVKLTSYNIFGLQEQALDEVTAHEYTISSAYVPAVSQLAAVTRYRQLADARTGYDVIISWTPPEISSYAGADVYARVKPAGETAFGAWDFVMRGDRQATINQARIGDEWQIKVVAVDAYNNRAAIATETTVHVVGKNVVPNTPQNFSISFGNEAVARWDDDFTSDVAFYELRLDEFAGTANSNLLLKTTSTSASIPLTERTGIVYLFACNAIGKYSAAAACEYNGPAPAAPTIKITNTLQGFSVSIQNKPEHISGTRVHISGGGVNETIETTGTFVSYAGAPGIYTVQATCFDSFGDGELSPAQEVIVKAKIDKNDIENLSIAEKDLDAALAERMRDVQTTKESVSSIVAKLSGNPQESGYSAITQIYNGLQLKVNQGDVVSAINVAPTGVKIDGRLLHITGNTIIDGNVIANHMLQAGAITADKLAVDSLSAISAKIGKLRTKDTGARTEISDNLIEVFDEGEKTRVRIGIFE